MVKRAFDLAVSLAGLAALGPLLLALAAAVRLGDRGPALYRGLRVGLDGRPFHILKFRTMVVGADRLGGPSTPDDDRRITRAGAFLRRHKLDELPQLLNVVRGDMSLVGPRPQVPSDVARYTAEERLLLTVRPGITDYASLRFRNEGEILRGHADPDEAYDRLIRPEKIRLGLEYVRTRSLRVDLGILVQTAMAVAGVAPGGAPGEDPTRS
ncbi:MAG: sugar transferase [Acidobacteria bacterium]|nr:sugar transferase [Acidobacteriota bacterium]